MKKKKLTNGEVSSLCLELSRLIHAGIGVEDGVHLLLEQEQDPTLKTLLTPMGQQLELGQPLSCAMEATGAFAAYATGLVRVGERSGRLEESLAALSTYYDQQMQLDQRIRGALFYPAMLLVLMLVVIAVLLRRVLPVFDEVFASLGGGLTGFAGWLLAIGQGPVIPAFCVILGVAALFLMLFAISETFRARLGRIWKKHCGNHGVARGVAQAQFAQALAMGMRSGLHTEQSLQLAAAFQTENAAFSRQVAICQMDVEQGENLAEALQKAGIFQPAVCRMLLLGSRSGSGDTVMQEIARRMAERSQIQIDALVSRVEPLLVMGTSLLVGVILLSVMLPLMNILTAIG